MMIGDVARWLVLQITLVLGFTSALYASAARVHKLGQELSTPTACLLAFQAEPKASF